MTTPIRSMLRLFVLFAWMLPGTVVADKPDAESAEAIPEEREDLYELYKVLADALDQVERNFVKPVSRRELVEAAVEGIIGKLDPYSSYIKEEELDQFRNQVESQFGGLGIQINIRRDRLTIVSPLVGTPAYRAGLIAGDTIVEIDGESTEGISINEAVRRLKGAPGTSVTLTVTHPGSTEPQQVEVTREVIHVKTVMGRQRKSDDSWDFIGDAENRIGYIRLTAFSRETADELKAAIETLEDEGFAALVLDLRFNPGGLLNEAVQVADLFLAEGLIVSTEGRNTKRRVWKAHKKGTFEGFPMAILVNRFTASAGEILAACLKDHGRAVIVGERTWGKGSVQNVIELEGGRSALKLTTASYQRPNGKKIHRFPGESESETWGVLPSDGFEVKLSEEDTTLLYLDQQRRHILKSRPADADSPADAESTENESEEPPPGDDTDPQNHPRAEFADRQLDKAMEYLRGELADAD